MQHNIALREYKTRLGVIYCFRYVFYFAIIPVETHGRASLQSRVRMDMSCVHSNVPMRVHIIIVRSRFNNYRPCGLNFKIGNK